MVAPLSFFFFFFPKWCLQILAAWLLISLTISTQCQGWFGKWGGGVGDGGAQFLWCFGASQQLQSPQEIQIQSKLHVRHPWHGHPWLQKHLHWTAIRANAGQKWFVKNRGGNDGLGKGEGCTKSVRQRHGSCKHRVCVCVCVHAIMRELRKAAPIWEISAPFRLELFPLGSGRDQALEGQARFLQHKALPCLAHASLLSSKGKSEPDASY